MEKTKTNDAEEKLTRIQEQFKKVLSPMEPTIMRIQSLLVWEYPIRSAVMIICVHGLFWFLTYSSFGIYSIVSTSILIAYFLHTWKKKIWPEIRVPPSSPDADEWTPVHPRLLSVPELCRHLSIFWCYLSRCANWWTHLRKTRPFKFCLEISFIFTCGAIVGHYISGVMLSYIIIMSIILWPCLQYHSLLQKVYMKFEPIFMKLDYSIKVKNKWRYEGDKSSVTTNENTEDDGKLTSSVCADNESDLEDFYPSDPLISAALARAITDSEDEGGTPSASTSLTPHLSKEPSVANSDDENHEEVMEDDFALSIDAMPSFEDTLDHTDDEMLSTDFYPETRSSRGSSKGRESSEEGIRFIPSHFEDSEDEDTLAQDLHFSKSGAQGRANENVTKALAENLVAKAITSVMGSALQGSVMGALQNLAVKSDPSLLQSPGDRVASTLSDSDDEDDIGLAIDDHDDLDGDNRQRLSEEDSASLNIEEDFEFLDEYELESSVEKE